MSPTLRIGVNLFGLLQGRPVVLDQDVVTSLDVLQVWNLGVDFGDNGTTLRAFDGDQAFCEIDVFDSGFQLDQLRFARRRRSGLHLRKDRQRSQESEQRNQCLRMLHHL
jgi:hypothetical protein